MITKLTNGKLVTEEKVLLGKDLYIEDGRILAITEERLPFDTQVDAGGNFVSAGFIDLHCHGAKGCDFADGTVAAVITASLSL